MNYGHLAFSGDRWVLSGLAPHVSIKLKAIFSKVPKSQTGTFFFSDTDDICADLSWFTSRYTVSISDEDRARLTAGRKLFEDRRSEIDRILLPDWSPPARYGFKPGFAPYHGQAQAIEIARRLGRLLVLDDVGLGKTICALGTIAGDPKYLPAAVIAPTHLPTQWVNEFISKFTYMSAHIIDGTKPYSLPPANIYLFKYSNMAGWADVAATGVFRSVIFDEMQELRHGAATEKGRAALAFTAKANLRLGLTGTPVYNYGSEIFNIVELIEPGSLGTYNEFVREWCKEQTPSGKWIVHDPDALGTYLRELQLVVRRVRQGRKINTLMVEVQHDEQVERDSIALARTLAMRVMTGSFTERGQAARELDLLARRITGVSKAKSVAAYARMLLKAGKPILIGAWHRECFARGTGVLMADGTVKAVETVAAGDRVMGPDGTPRNVLNTLSGTGPLYRVTPNKGESWTCSKNHLLVLRGGKPGRRIKLMRACDFARLTTEAKKHYVQVRAGLIEFGGDRVLEPWLLGYWLGDGASRLQDLRIATADREVVDELSIVASRHNLQLRRNRCASGERCSFYTFSTGTSGKWGRNTLQSHFKALALHRNKHIPQSYKTAPAADRWDLLGGLIDSDGYVCQGNGAGTVEFTNKNERLARDVVFIARSLGLAAYLRKETRRTNYSPSVGCYCRVSISGDLTPLSTKITRKRPLQRKINKNVCHVGVDLHIAETGQYFGFETDGDHLFLLDDFTVVHNCYEIFQKELAEFKPAMFTGTESPKEKDRSKQAFITGDTDCVLMSLRSGLGIDGLQKRCSTVLFAEFDWSSAVATQFIGRVDRPGQPENEIDAIYCWANSGSDPVMIELHGLKANQARGIVDPLRGVETIYSDESRIKLLAQRYLDGDA